MARPAEAAILPFPMTSRLWLAAAAATVAYFAMGFAIFGLLPFVRAEFAAHPGVFRTPDVTARLMPLGLAAMFLAIAALAWLYAKLRGSVSGVRFGMLIGVFAAGAFTIHHYVDLNIGWRLAAIQTVAYLLEWIVVGAILGRMVR